MEWDETFDSDVIYKEDFTRMGMDELLDVIRHDANQAESLLDILMNEVRGGLGDGRMAQRGMYAMLKSLRSRVTNVRNAHRHYGKIDPQFNREKVLALAKASNIMIKAAKDVSNKTGCDDPIGSLEAAYEDFMSDYDEDGRFHGNRG